MTWKILDCTLRDGGYYNNWDFQEDLVRRYARTLGAMPVDVLEVGYRNPPGGAYNGRYFHLSRHTLDTLREYAGPGMELAFMVDGDDTAQLKRTLRKELYSKRGQEFIQARRVSP